MWENHFLEILDKHAPIKRTKVKVNNQQWMTSCLKDVIALCDKLKRKAIITKLETDWANYKKNEK